VRGGDERAAVKLVERYGPAIRRVMRVRLHDRRFRGPIESGDICRSLLASFVVPTKAVAFARFGLIGRGCSGVAGKSRDSYLALVRAFPLASVAAAYRRPLHARVSDRQRWDGFGRPGSPE
jgi:hypothetical protein